MAMDAGIRFGRLAIDADARRLWVDGQPVGIGGRGFDLLLALAERRDRVVGKRELLDLVWPGLAVEENNLQVQVCTLRKLLGEQAIVTVPRRGYRLVAESLGVPAGPGQPPRATGDGPDRDAGGLAPDLLTLLSRHRVVTLLAGDGDGDGDAALPQALALAHRAAVQSGGMVWHGQAGAATPVPEALLLRRAAHADLLLLDARTASAAVLDRLQRVLDRAPRWRALAIARQALGHDDEACRPLPADRPAGPRLAAPPPRPTPAARMRWQPRP